jgi:hypothetical protein
VWREAKSAAPSRGSIDGAPGSYIIADDEEDSVDFTRLKFACHKKNNNKYDKNRQNIVLQGKLLIIKLYNMLIK